FDSSIEDLKENKNYSSTEEFTGDDWEFRCDKFLKKVVEHTGNKIPSKAHEQLIQAVEGVFKSSFSPRANAFKKIQHIYGNIGVGIIVQKMVFGNIGSDSAAGTMFTRNP